MVMKNSCAMLLLAAVSAVSLNTDVSGQGVRRSGNRSGRVTVRRDGGATRKNVVHDHRNKARSKGFLPTGIQLPGRLLPATKPKRGSTPAPPDRLNPHDHRKSSMSFTEASRLFSSHKQWMIGANTVGYLYPIGKFIRSSDKSYNLKGLRNRKFLWYKGFSFLTVNVGWTKNASAETARKTSQWQFLRYSKSRSALRYGEPFAIRRNGPSPYFLNYGKQRIGIDLKEGKKPSYEWAILGGKPGDMVKGGRDTVVLYNLRHQEPLVYFNRRTGGDIGWSTSRRASLSQTVFSPKYIKKMRSAAQALLMPGVVVGK